MKKQTLNVLLLLVGAVISTSTVQAAERLTVPDEYPGIPIYLQTDLPPLLPDTATWAPIVFYRDPECVPEDFNLMEVVDFTPDPDFGLRVWRCPLTVKEFEIFTAPPSEGPPIFLEIHGLGAVPMWFVSWPELREAIADGVLTITELKSLQSLQKGQASFFQLSFGPTGGAQHPNYHLVAGGHLEDGRSFDCQIVVTEQSHPVFVGDRIVVLKIEFK